MGNKGRYIHQRTIKMSFDVNHTDRHIVVESQFNDSATGRTRKPQIFYEARKTYCHAYNTHADEGKSMNTKSIFT